MRSGAFNSAMVIVVMRRAFCVGRAKRRLGSPALPGVGWMGSGHRIFNWRFASPTSLTRSRSISGLRMASVRPKADVSRATEADIAAEHAVRARIMETRPDDGFRGEELGEVVGTTGQRWIVDWMDGTGFFVAGQFTSPRFRVVAARHSEGAAGRGPEPTALVGRWPGRGIRRRRSITIWRCQGNAPLMSAIR